MIQKLYVNYGKLKKMSIEIEINEIVDRETFCNRKWFNKNQIEALADSIKRIGLQNPIIVRKHPENNGYQIISGENRLRALELLKRNVVTAKIVELTDDEADTWSFESNLFHEGGHLHPIEQGFFFHRMNKKGKTLDEIAKEFKINQKTVSYYKSLTKLSLEMQEIFYNQGRRFRVQQAIQIVRLSKHGENYQKEAWDKLLSIRDNRLRTAAELEKIVNRIEKDIEREKARVKELAEILSLYWDQTESVLAELRGRFEKLGYNNDQIRGEILRLNERHDILTEIENNEDLDSDFVYELMKWVEQDNPSNLAIRRRVKDYLDEKEKVDDETPLIVQTVFMKSSERITELEDNSIHLVITSPPYWNLKNYGDQIKQMGYMESYDDYIRRLCNVLQESIRVTVPGGKLCINVGDVFTSSKHYGRYKVMAIHSRVIEFCEANGVDYVNSIFWKKIGKSIGGGGIKGGVMGSYPHPPNGIINNDVEYILIFKKPGKREKPSSEIVNRHIFTQEEWMEHFNQVWDDVRPASQRKGHPAVFPDLLPIRLIRMFSFEGETILDPFLGTGTTLKVAREMNRSGVGYEINPKYATLIKEKCPYAKIIDADGTIIQNYNI